MDTLSLKPYIDSEQYPTNPEWFEFATPGVASGSIAFEENDVRRLRAQGKDAILVVNQLEPSHMQLLPEIAGAVVLGKASQHAKYVFEAHGKQLNVPVENILGLAGLESSWGTSSIAQNANNFFGLHYSANVDSGDPYVTSQGAEMSQFNSYEESLQAFVSREGNFVRNISDPVAFATALQNQGKFGINTDDGANMPQYVRDLVATIHSVPRETAK